MKHIFQLTLILGISLLGELLNALIPLPIPGSIYGLVLMLILLISGVFQVEQVKTTGDWLLSLMPVMFVGPVVGLIDSFDSYKDFLLPLVIIIPVTTLLTMAVTGRTVQWLISLQKRKEERGHAE